MTFPSTRGAAGVLLLLLVSCGGGGGSSGSRGTQPPPPPAGDASAPTFVQAPQVTPNPSGFAPLTARFTAETNEKAALVLHIDDGSRSWDLGPDVAQTHHAFPLLGLRPDRRHRIRVQATDQAGNEGPVQKLVLDTPPLPPDFPPLRTVLHQPARIEPGITAFSAQVNRDGVLSAFLLMVDGAGEVVWYYHDPTRNPLNLELTRSGTFLCIDTTGAFEIDLFGNTVNLWWPTGWDAAGMPAGATPVDIDSFHHELVELPESEDAELLALSTELRHFADYPQDEVDTSITGPAAVAGDVIVEFNRDGTIVRTLNLLDVLDPYRVAYLSLGGFWFKLYGQSFDWSHANSVMLDRSDDTYIVSVRHQDVVVKVKRHTGEIVWMFGPFGRWNDPWRQHLLVPEEGAFEWSYHQHVPRFNQRGNLVLFDNGLFRAIPPDPGMPPDTWYSRAVEYQLDPLQGTLRQVWAYGGAGDPWLSRSLGEAAPLPLTDNVLITYGAPVIDGMRLPRLLEVTTDAVAQPVFELTIEETAPLTTWSIYRARRMAPVW